MLVKKYSLNPTRISKTLFTTRLFCRNITQEELETNIFVDFKLYLGQANFIWVRNSFIAFFYHKNCDFYIWLFQTLLGQAPWKLFRSIWSILPTCTLLLFSSVNYIQMSDAATDFMPDIESSVKCLLYWDQNQRMGDRSALVTLLSQDLHPLLTGAQNETVMEHSLMLTMQKIVLPI